MFYFSKKVRFFSQNDVLFLFYFLINPAGTTVVLKRAEQLSSETFVHRPRICQHVPIEPLISLLLVSKNTSRNCEGLSWYHTYCLKKYEVVSNNVDKD